MNHKWGIRLTAIEPHDVLYLGVLCLNSHLGLKGPVSMTGISLLPGQRRMKCFMINDTI